MANVTDSAGLSASNILTKVAQPDYWSTQLDLRTPPELEGAGPGGNPAGNVYTQPGSIAPSTGTGGGSAAAPETPDWEQVLIAQGMPASLVSQIGDYMSAHADDPDLKTKVLYIVRGSDWWKQTFPGFWEGASRGLFTDETGYRAWYSGANDAFKRYYGRDLTAGEVVNYLHQGYGANDIEQVGQGHAYATANTPDIQYVEGAFDQGQLTPDQIEAYGQQKAGKQNAAGAGLDVRINAAIQRMQRIFQGTLASPNFNLGNNGLAAPSGKNPDLPS